MTCIEFRNRIQRRLRRTRGSGRALVWKVTGTTGRVSEPGA
jgi:hypothetical protein